MERNNTKLIVVSQHAMMTWGPILEQLFEQCHCSDRFSVCGFEEFLLHREYGNPYIIVLDSEDDCLQAANILHNFSVCVMNLLYIQRQCRFYSKKCALYSRIWVCI